MEIQGEKSAILTTLRAIFAGINMLCGLTIKAAKTWIGYSGSKTMTHSMKHFAK